MREQYGRRWNPVQFRPASSSILRVLHLDRVAVPAFELQRRWASAAAALARPQSLSLPRPQTRWTSAGASTRIHLFAVQVQGDLPIAVPLSSARRDHVIARSRRNQSTGPADRVFVAMEGCDHRRLFHVGIEVNARIHATQLRLAMEIRVVEILGLESLPLAVRRRKEAGVHQRWRGGRVGRPKRVLHPGFGELLLDAFERSHLPGGNTVIVTQQADWIVGRRADYRDFGYRRFQWQETTLILQQHDGFAFRPPRQ